MKKRAVLMARTNVPPEVEAEWNIWYDTKHVPSRVGNIPGFLAGRRFVAIEGEPKYLTLWELSGVDVLTSKAYLKEREAQAQLPQDSFEARTGKFPDFSRGLYEQIYPREGEYRVPNTKVLLAVGHDVPPDKEEEFNAWYDTDHIPALTRVPGIVATRRFVAAEGLPAGAGSMSGGPKYVALYDLESEKVLQSDAFLKARESPWGSWVRKWNNRRFRMVVRRIYPKD